MTIRFGKIACSLFPTIALLAVSSQSMASTLNQNVSWTIDRTGTTAKYRVVAYGDSIYAGYNGSTSNAAKYAGTTVESEYGALEHRCRKRAASQVRCNRVRCLQQQNRRGKILHASGIHSRCHI